MQAFFVAIAVEILKHFGAQATEATKKQIVKHLLIKESDGKAEKYDEIVNDPSKTLEDMLRANDEFGA